MNKTDLAHYLTEHSLVDERLLFAFGENKSTFSLFGGAMGAAQRTVLLCLCGDRLHLFTVLPDCTLGEMLLDTSLCDLTAISVSKKLFSHVVRFSCNGQSYKIVFQGAGASLCAALCANVQAHS